MADGKIRQIPRQVTQGYPPVLCEEEQIEEKCRPSTSQDEER